MDNLSIRINDHRTGFDQTIEISTNVPTFIGNLTSTDIDVEYDLQAAANGTPDRAQRFVDNGDGTVTDTVNRLMWSRGNVGDDRVDWADANKACTELDLAGHTDWRLPTRVELLTLVDDTRISPAIDTAAFPDTKSNWYWTGTEYAGDSSDAWFVGFLSGGSGYYLRGGGAFVRAVRSLPAGQ